MPRLFTLQMPALTLGAWLFGLFFPLVLQADGIILKDGQGIYQPGLNLSILEDKGKKLSFQDVSSAKYSSAFKPSTSDTPNFSFSKSAYWIRMTVRNDAPLSSNAGWLLELSHPIIDEVEFHSINALGGHDSVITGDHLKFKERELVHRNFVFRLNLKAGESRTYYLRVASESTISVPLHIWSRDEFIYKDNQQLYVLGMYFGIILVMAGYNLFLFMSLRDMSYLLYVLLILAGGGYATSIQGIGYQYFWPIFPGWASIAPIFFLAAVSLFILAFDRLYLSLKENLPRTDILFKVLMGVNILLALLASFGPIELASKIISVFAMLGIVLSVYAGVMCWVKGYRPAKYFLLAWIGWCIASFIYGLRAFDVIPDNVVTSSTMMMIGHVSEIMLLSLALANKINIIKEEKQEAQSRAIENLRRADEQKEEFLGSLKTLNEAYSRFVPQEFLAFLSRESIVDVELGDQTQRNMAIVFIDIRNFTTLSETMTPKENFDFINSYMGRMGPVIRKHNGIIDKYIGDAIMALFHSSDDAIQAAIGIQTTLREYNIFREERGYRAIRVGIGMHTGSLMLGTIGDSVRMEGTVISDAVNLASRMEHVTKLYDANIVVSGTTLYDLEDPLRYNYRPLGIVQVKGKQEPITIFEILDGDAPEVKEMKLAYRMEFEQAITYLLSKDLDMAQKMFEQVLAANPDDKAAILLAKKIATKTKVKTLNDVADI